MKADLENRSSSTSVAGGSARAEFERRRQREREARRRARPFVLAFGAAVSILGLLMAAFGPIPPGPVGPALRMLWLVVPFVAVPSTLIAMVVLSGPTLAWRTGALGEERTAELLRPLGAQGFRVIHDRLIPGSRANIDHIVVGPPGVFVVETKSYTGKLRVRGREIWIAGQRKTDILAQVRREADAVAAIVAPGPVTPLICIHRADLGWSKIEVQGVRIVTPRELVKVLRKAAAVLAANEVAALAKRIDRSFVPAAGDKGRVIAEA
jgi:hypothetical protein